ncbi:hypothetical protein BJX63DRAFT_436989 [Aspergillus granulosus]|uniref:Uncharacterized protein n=1 Tax=Aspergillus granulosus TaxID=176169 RepID=A0ABR4GWE0_9EURO
MREDSEEVTPGPVCMPKIYLGDASPAPRWLIRPADPESKQDLSGESSISSGSKLPPLGKLRWEFDPGMHSKHGLDEAWLRGYAYQYLLNSLGDPVVRDQMRDLIWNGPHAPTVAHVEDPLPVPPPPPHFKDKKPSDYVSLRQPISASAPDDYYFMYPAYERPSLTARVRTKADIKSEAEGAGSNDDPFSTDADDSSDWETSSDQDRLRATSVPGPNYQLVSDIASTRRSSASTIICTNTGRSWHSCITATARTRTGTEFSSHSSISVSPKELSKSPGIEDSDSPGYNPSCDDDGRHIRPGQYKWVWVFLTVLILSMFLCLFLYVFGILR